LYKSQFFSYFAHPNKGIMKKLNLLFPALLALLPLAMGAQNELYNNGASIYVQKGAIVHVNGEIQNQGATATVQNDGVIELTGDFTNNSSSIYQNGTDATGERATKFIGSGTQNIIGDMADATNRYFYNLIVDKSVSGTALVLRGNSYVTGSLVWGSATTGSATYTPTTTSQLTNNSGNGIIQTYYTGTDYELYVKNNAASAVKGYASEGSLAMNLNPTDKYVLVQGLTSVGTGGFSRDVAAGNFAYPLATASKGYNPIMFHFNSVNASNPKVRSKFTDVTGTMGSISQWCYTGCTPDNTGYNRFISNAAGDLPSCLGLGAGATTGQWIIFTCMPTNHGYWSFSGDAADNYWIESFPNTSVPGYSLCGAGTDNWRLIKENTTAFNSAPSVDWRTSIESSITSTSDLANYTRFGGSGCYTGNGVPGGTYTGFSHFQLARMNNNNALPVEMIDLRADAIDNNFIRVFWATATEVNNKGFDVMRSTDGIHFTKIGWVDGNGNTTDMRTYKLDDHEVVANQVYYYRLNQIDFDGKAHETKIVSANLTASETFSISDFFPNPASTASSVMINTSREVQVDLQVYNNLGQVVSKRLLQLLPGSNRVDVAMNDLAAGTYHAIFTWDKGHEAKPVVLTNEQ
jgi:hypothetical protein